MSGPLPVIGSLEPWAGGEVLPGAVCVLAGNPSPMTLDGTNTWIIGTGDQAVVIDPGPAAQQHLVSVRRRLEELDLRPVTILLTHGHADHSEAAGMFAESLRVPVRALDPAHTLGGEGLVPGDVVVAGETEVVVIATPGHTADSLSFYLPRQRAVLTGDTLLGRGTTVVAWPDGSLSAYLESLGTLTELAQTRDLDHALPGHGPAVTRPATLLAEYLEHRHQRLDQVREAIAQGATSIAEVVAMVYEPLPPGVYPAAFASAGAQWEYLVERGEAPAEPTDNGIPHLDH